MKNRRIIDKILLGIGITLAVPLGLALLLPFLLLALLCVHIVQGNAYDAMPDQIMFLNESSSTISSVAVNDTAISDNTLYLGDSVTVEWEQWPATLTAYGEGGALWQLELPKAPQKDDGRDCWYIIAQDGPDGLILTQSHVEKLGKRVKSMGERVNLDVSAGTVELYHAPGRGINGDGHDFMILRFGESEAAALEVQMAAAKGWHSYKESELLNKVFFHEHSYCRYYICDIPRLTEGWYFFRDTYNSQHGANDENQWAVEGRTSLPGNYTAAIYDRDTRTLYIYDFDS